MGRIRSAEFRVNGPLAALDGFRDLLLRTLVEEAGGTRFDETVGDGVITYHFAACNGLPFPAFAEATEAYPDVIVAVRWEDADTGAAHFAAIRSGTVGSSESRREQSGEPPVYVRMAGDGTLILALCISAPQEEGPRLGCVVISDRDGMFLFARRPGEGEELLTTGDDLVWSARWVRQDPGAVWDEGPLQAPRTFSAEHEQRLNELADALLREWLWYAEGSGADVAVEAERYRLYGFSAGKANVRSAAIKRMGRHEDGGREFFEYSSLAADDLVVKEAVERCWLIG